MVTTVIIPAYLAQEITNNSEDSIKKLKEELSNSIDLMASRGYSKLTIFHGTITSFWSGLSTFDLAKQFIKHHSFIIPELKKLGYTILILPKTSQQSEEVIISWDKISTEWMEEKSPLQHGKMGER